LIQGILTYQFKLNQKEDTGEIDPEFSPIQLIFQNENFKEDNYSNLVIENDIFATFYQHTVGMTSMKYGFSNFYMGRFKETPYQVMSYFKQIADGTQFLVMVIFETDDEIELFEDIIKTMSKRLNDIFERLAKANNTRQLDLISNVNVRLKNELKYTVFQIERLSALDKLQKVALIYNSDERIRILEILRERPVSKDEIKKIVEKMKPTANIDILLRPFLELNLIRRDWIKGEKDKKTGIVSKQGEYLFMVKDILIARVPNESLLKHFKETNNELLEVFQQKSAEFFFNYDPYTQPIEETKKIASIMLNPDIYDFFILMRSNHYPLDKIPKVFSEFAITEILLDNLKKLNIITEIKDENKRSWILLLTNIQPITIFPEFLLPKIREAYRKEDEEGKITYEIAKKALNLLEVSYPEKITF
jgi:predicted SnoaL-like aldol condensation-catalyzing enzyme